MPFPLNVRTEIWSCHFKGVWSHTYTLSKALHCWHFPLPFENWDWSIWYLLIFWQNLILEYCLNIFPLIWVICLHLHKYISQVLTLVFQNGDGRLNTIWSWLNIFPLPWTLVFESWDWRFNTMWYYMIVTQYFIFALSLVLEYTSLVPTLGLENWDFRFNSMWLWLNIIPLPWVLCLCLLKYTS